MRAKALRKAAWLLALSMAGAGIALASNTSWFAVDTTYGTNGVSEALTSTSYGRSNAVDHSDVNHRVYSLVGAHPSGYVGPFTLTRRLSSGAIDTAFGASGVTTSFANYNDPNSVNAFDALCIDPVTHGLVLAGEVKGGGVIVERLLPPDANGVAALDTSFNPNGGTPGVVTWTKSRPSLNVRPRGCTVLGDRSIFVAGPDGSAPSRLAMDMVSADGDPSGFTFCCRAGVVTPTGDNWEGGSIEWNSSQTINPNLIIMGSVSHNAVLYAVDPCTGAGDANVNGNGFLSVPAIDGHTYSDPIVGAVQGDGSILLALLASDSLNADLVGWSYPVMPNAWQTPTAPGMVTVPAGVMLAGGSYPAPVRQADGTILVGAETATNQQVLFALQGDAALGFTVAAPRGFCGTGMGVKVPDVVNETQSEATTTFTSIGLTTGTVTQQSSRAVTSGHVISENPAAGTWVTSGAAVSLVISTGSGTGGSSGGGGNGGGGSLDWLLLSTLVGACAWLALTRCQKTQARSPDESRSAQLMISPIQFRAKFILRTLVSVISFALPITGWTANLGQVSSGSTKSGVGGPVGWRSIGPAPPAIEANIAADARSHTIYIGATGGGVIKSTDGGATFRAVNTGLPAGGTISGLVMAPGNPNVVYVNTQFDGLYKTVDGGAHWTGGSWGGLTLVMDPNNPDVMYGASGPIDYLLKTTDGGATWSYVADGLGDALVFAIAIDPHNSNVLYAGSAGQGAFKSADAGTTWKPISIDSNVNVILVDPDNSSVVYAGTDGHGVFRSTNGGRSFVRIGSPRVTSILSLAKSGQTLYAGTATQGVSESIDGGRTWKNSQVSSGLGNVLSVDSQGSVYVGTNFDGAFVRSVSDSDWHRLGWNLLKRCACQEGDSIAIDPGDHNHLLLTTNGGGLLASDDGGRSWHDGGTEGLTSNGPRVVAFDPQDARRVYTGSVWGGGLYRSEDGGRHWQRRRFGPADITVYGIAVDPVDHSVYATTVGNAEGLWKSTDFGNSFTRIDRAPSAPAGVYLGFSGPTVTVDPHNHATVYFPDNGGLWRSQDAGRTWVEVDASGNFTSVTVDPIDSSIVYAGGYSLLKSIDGGATFTPKSVGLPYAGVAETGSLQIDPRHPNVLYLGMEDGGVFKSTDAAETWFPINLGFGGTTHYDTSITGLAMDPEEPDTLYAVTYYHAVYKTVSGGR